MIVGTMSVHKTWVKEYVLFPDLLINNIPIYIIGR